MWARNEATAGWSGPEGIPMDGDDGFFFSRRWSLTKARGGRGTREGTRDGHADGRTRGRTDARTRHSAPTTTGQRHEGTSEGKRHTRQKERREILEGECAASAARAFPGCVIGLTMQGRGLSSASQRVRPRLAAPHRPPRAGVCPPGEPQQTPVPCAFGRLHISPPGPRPLPPNSSYR